MESQTFFTGSNRRVILGSPTLQSTSRRICIPVRMPLTSEPLVGMPDWVGTAYEAVSKYLNVASPEVQQVADVLLAFANNKPAGELFEHPAANVHGAELKAFSVTRAGEDGDPEVELQFKVYAPFARDFWVWIGEMAGKEVWMGFPKSLAGAVVIPPQTKPLYDDPSLEADRREALKPEHDEEFADNEQMPVAPSVEDQFGPEYQEQVRKSMGAPEAFGSKPRLVDARPGRDKTGPKPKSGSKTSLVVN